MGTTKQNNELIPERKTEMAEKKNEVPSIPQSNVRVNVSKMTGVSHVKNSPLNIC